MDLTQTAVIRIEAKQVDRLYNVAHLDCIAAVVGSALLLTAGWIFEVPKAALVLSAIPILVGIGRWAVALSYNRASPPSSAIRRWGLIFNLGASIGALSWGAVAAYFIYLDNLAAAAAAIGVAAVMSLSTVIMYAGALPITLVFAGLALAPAAAVAAARADQIGAILSAALIGAFVIAALCAMIIKRMVWESVIAHSENEQLAGHLDQRRTQVEKLNVALKTNTDKREQAEITLRRTAADLGLVQGKAKALADTLERVSPMCQVTGLANRKHFDQQLESEWRRATREQKPMSLIIVGIDEFEEYVDAYGRQSSDSLLKRVGHSIKGFGRRSGDLAGRYEDEKLALMLPGCDARNAARMAEALRKRIESTKIAHAGSKNREMATVHVGVATIKPARSLPTTELQKRTDGALYEARFQGGNKVVTYKPLSKLKLERWNQPSDGPLSEQSMTQKLLVWGYDTVKDILRPGEKPREHVSEDDTVIAILAGELLIDVEGHTMAIKAGDTIFIPHGIAILLQASGDKPVVKFTATKSK
jgi:diguanylate cyclase (GGDEF)-like protein